MENECPVFYFSGTGGCLATATTICQAVPDCMPVPIAACRDGFVVDSDTIGFVFPLYFAGLPRIVARFVRNLRFKKTCYVFAVVACGFPWSGFALHQLSSLLRKKGQRLSAGWYLKMTDNYLPHYDVPSALEQEKIDRDCEKKLDAIVVHIQAHDSHREKESAFYLYAMYPFFIRLLRRNDRHFSVDACCNGCGTCTKVCPVDNVVMHEGKPHWQHQCEFCLACISYCPKVAIQWKTVTQSKGRYHYKGITATQIAGQKGHEQIIR